ncbi:hypothetical protein pkur_cds_535 [Pandoravirus kuranda]|uniref:Uncharacterized protein n=2 Tax=Pandoravirus TaxID=2060084 RepID=A0AA95EIS7_9VIRU|nr:hypothetical protein pneo_cds_571 [Pandoravirus neocaledonia]AVK76178.1 hypothetical protein pneo_cds_571 [Pandoravirus neocaledonia]WBR14709.1 hypothetical protein pkur_cds_535 [Pandoravirus kuranda]
MQHETGNNKTQGHDENHVHARDSPGPTDEDYKGLYDDLTALRRSWALMDPQDPAQWDRDSALHITKDPYP